MSGLLLQIVQALPRNTVLRNLRLKVICLEIVSLIIYIINRFISKAIVKLAYVCCVIE
jgi:hypothetical protein